MVQIRGNTQIMAGTIADAQISATAAIALSKLAEGLEIVKRNGTVAFTGDINAGTHKLTNLAPATADTDAPNWGQVQAIQQGLQLKASVRVASVPAGNVNIATGGLLTIDGVTLVAGDRVLLKDQTVAAQNGIYVAAAGVWTRSTDADGQPDPNNEVKPGMFTFVNEGTVNADSGWVLATNGAITVGTTDLAFVQFSAAGVLTAGAALAKVGNQINVVVKEGVEIDGNALRVKTDGASLAQSAQGVKVADGGVTNEMLAGDIDLSKLTDAGELVQRDGSVAFTGPVNVGGQKLTSVANGTVSTDGVNKGQLDSAIAAVDVTAQIAPIQAEIDKIETGAGLSAAGDYVVDATTSYLTGATSLANADKLLDTKIKANSDAIDALELSVGSGTADIQAELDKVEAGAGLAANGDYAVPTGTTYLGASTSLADADKKLDVAVKANADAIVTTNSAATALQAEVDAIELGVGLNADGSYLVPSNTNYLAAAVSLNDADKKLDAAIKVNATDIVNIKVEIDAIEAGAGLGVDGTYTPDATTNYIKTAASLKDADKKLDLQIKANTDAIATLGSTGIGAIQTEVDAIETAVGLNTNGTFAADATTNYLTAATSVKDADKKLDTQLKIATDKGTSLQTELDATQTGAGLTATGTYTADATTTYLKTATSLFDADKKLDAQLLVLANGKLDKTAVNTDATFTTPLDTEVPSSLAVKTYLQAAVAGNAVGFVDLEVPVGAIDGANVTYTLAGVANPPESVHFFVNGLRTATATVVPGATTTTVTVATALQTGDNLTADYRI